MDDTDSGSASGPGPFERVDLTNLNLSKAFDARSHTIQKHTPAMPADPSDRARPNTPGSPVGREENAVKRQAPFGEIDDVKASARRFKLALYDPNGVDLPDAHPQTGAAGSSVRPGDLERYVNSGPRAGDLAANQPLVVRPVEPDKPVVPARSKAAAPIPSLPLAPEEAEAGTKMDPNEPDQPGQTGVDVQRVGPALGLAQRPVKQTSFLSRFLRGAYER